MRTLCRAAFLASVALALPAQALAQPRLVPDLHLQAMDPQLDLISSPISKSSVLAGMLGALGQGGGHLYAGDYLGARNWFLVDLGLAGLGGLSFLIAAGVSPDVQLSERPFVAFLPLIAWGAAAIVLRVKQIISAVRAQQLRTYHARSDNSFAW